MTQGFQFTEPAFGSEQTSETIRLNFQALASKHEGEVAPLSPVRWQYWVRPSTGVLSIFVPEPEPSIAGNFVPIAKYDLVTGSLLAGQVEPVFEQRAISALEISNKEMILLTQPASVVFFSVKDGADQYQGQDFTVLGQTLSWNSLPLDVLIAEGDLVRLAYRKVLVA